MQRERIAILVTKNSGAAARAAKLVAARSLGLPVVMVERPVPAGGPVLTDLAAVEAWIAAHRATSG